MNWDAIGAVGEILGATGVIVTLLYLTSQIRQNTRAMRSQALQSITQSGATMNGMLVQDDDVARIFNAGLTEDYSSLTQEERTRFSFLIGQWALAYEAVYIQKQLGTVDSEIFESRMNNLRIWLNTPGGLRAWNAAKPTFTKGYVEYVDENVIITQ